MTFSILEAKLHEIREQVYEKLNELIPERTDLMESKLFEAMRYTTLSHGKRLRPFMTVISSQLFGVSLESALQVASAIECIQSYSLIHDDLPALDNDDFRRGQPSCHKKFGEAIAILTGDALLTFAFEILSYDSTHYDPVVRVELIKTISTAAGFAGMVGGQVIDMITENQKLEFNEIVRLQRMKTGALFAISCEAGAILGKAPKNLRNALRAYANNLGLAFQIVNDLLDAEGNAEESGKAVQRDAKAGKATLISAMGIDQAKEHARMLASQAVDYLAPFGDKAILLKDLARYIVDKNIHINNVTSFRK